MVDAKLKRKYDYHVMIVLFLIMNLMKSNGTKIAENLFGAILSYQKFLKALTVRLRTC